ncbi:type II toxin-antitoxin system HicA family toxin [Helicobacter pylori]|uniref:type II toxin-antitoxin system HicA family toxin n=1 Tax=Helicobacter pylori TaxID=210 RepID=UPI002577D11E|nr:type II toxin-antitoxin system HicA family toxin [Helicobacter pylori]WJJ00213.1 type II toxin-antitoxin system HicA family toxin [Helicobacter pylori]WJJ05127.1 type II toxin-antitoxin system HicA family toxin [Helicobacter pylori]
MPELPRLTAKEAEKLLLQNGFILSRQKGSHRIYVKDKIRQVLPSHSGEILHPKIVKEIMENALK